MQKTLFSCTQKRHVLFPSEDSNFTIPQKQTLHAKMIKQPCTTIYMYGYKNLCFNLNGRTSEETTSRNEHLKTLQTIRTKIEMIEPLNWGG